ncbi:MAG TPA: polyamine aminopropyltransferase [Burkholderiales bacterium]|nr:polyamine aminopropyltransferase [Burkholderiales bacterium]
MDGLHLVANLYRCKGNRRYSTDAAFLRRFLLDSIASAGLTALGDLFHQFEAAEPSATNTSPGGVTGCVVLAESHLAIHTWPELEAVTLDVYVCNYTQDNSDKARQVLSDCMRIFEPADYVRHDVPRDKQLMMEYVNPEHGYFVHSTARLAELRTQYQALEIHDSPQFGKLMRLDGCFMTSERDEFHYHENLIHPALIAHPAPRRGLIIGGGDGGAAEEVLKHSGIEALTMVELDGAVVDAAKRYLPTIHRGAFDDPRMNLVIDDGMRFIAETKDRYDFIALDLPDPIGPATALYEEAFFRDCAKLLKAGGVLTLHMGSPIARPDRVRAHAERLTRVFNVVRPMILFVPLYGTLWSMACCSDSTDPGALSAEEADKRIAQRGLRDLQYYNGATHQGVFALPNFMRDLVAPTEQSRILSRRAVTS